MIWKEFWGGNIKCQKEGLSLYLILMVCRRNAHEPSTNKN